MTKDDMVKKPYSGIKSLDKLRFKAAMSRSGCITVSIEELNTIKEEVAAQPSNPADSEKVTTESVTQPKIDFCHACGTALGCR